MRLPHVWVVDWLLAGATEIIEPSVSLPPADKPRVLHAVVSTFQKAARKSQPQCSLFKALFASYLLLPHWPEQMTQLIRARGGSIRL